MAGKTLYDKLWDMHLVKQRDDGSALIYIDLHILHEVTSPQAFEGLRLAGRKPWRIDANIATPDHNVPTTRTERKGGIAREERDQLRSCAFDPGFDIDGHGRRVDRRRQRVGQRASDGNVNGIVDIAHDRPGGTARTTGCDA